MGLILTVERGDKITIGDDITATIQRIYGGKLQIRFDAPRSVQINSQTAEKERIAAEESLILEKANRLSPEQQRNNARNKLNRGNKNG